VSFTSRKLAAAVGTVGGEVLFQQLVDDDLGCASYLIADETAREAVVVDPAYAIERYLEAAEQAGVRIVRVLETHNHADHVSGHGRFALEHDVPVSIHALAGVEYSCQTLADGDEVTVGSLTIEVLHTPGHRPEHCCFLVAGHLLSGDSLLIGDAARPDLAIDAREGAEDLFASLRRLTELPDEVEVDPGHTGGSLCGAGLSRDRVSTIGSERLTNHALAIGDLQEFVAHSAAISAPRPPTVERVVALNRGPFLAAQPPLELLDAPRGQLLDVRTAGAHADGYAHGAVNVPLDGSSVGTKAAFVLDHDEPITIHAASAEDAAEAARRLNAVGLLGVAGFALELETPERVQPVGIDELETLLAEDSAEVLDVREKDERDEGYIPGTRHIPYRLVRAFRDELDNGRPVVTVCSSGARAGVAASVLAAEGVRARPVLNGGIDDWQQRGHQLTAFRRCGST
jgi:glyoxylase-like metal-dependent hydrolase (beta-lactamase superfamily II)/rhodanese-related sulfurtransferase